MRHCANLTPSDIWIGNETVLPVFEKLYEDDAKKPIFVCLDGKSGTSWAQVVQAGSGKSVRPLDTDDVLGMDALVMFSSGTTGLPKGVVLTNLNVVTTRKQTL